MTVGQLKGGHKFPVDGFLSIGENPIIGGSMLYIRECYSRFYDIVKKVGTCAMIGVPGVGKSCFLIYFILRLLFESTEDQRVIFEPNSKVLYLFVAPDSSTSVVIKILSGF